MSKVTFHDIEAIVTDIEGTTTPITFVHETLFPFAKNNLRNHLVETFETSETREDIRLLAEQAAKDREGNEKDPNVQQYVSAPPIDLSLMLTGGDDEEKVKDEKRNLLIDQVVANVQFNMALDRKMAALKSLQGHIWKFGYESGKVVGEVYSDVVPVFSRWKNDCGKSLFVYSSGSVFAQKLLFGYSTDGDITPLFNGYFDTVHPGSKLEANSYETIARDIGHGSSPDKILFLTDNIHEAVAAKQAGWNVVLSVRPGTAPLPEKHEFQTVTSFDQIELL